MEKLFSAEVFLMVVKLSVAILILGILILIAYGIFDAIESKITSKTKLQKDKIKTDLWKTGLGLTISGVLSIAINYGLYKYKLKKQHGYQIQ